VRYYNKGAI